MDTLTFACFMTAVVASFFGMIIAGLNRRRNWATFFTMVCSISVAAILIYGW